MLVIIVTIIPIIAIAIITAIVIAIVVVIVVVVVVVVVAAIIIIVIRVADIRKVVIIIVAGYVIAQDRAVARVDHQFTPTATTLGQNTHPSQKGSIDFKNIEPLTLQLLANGPRHAVVLRHGRRSSQAGRHEADQNSSS
ncbi:MAG: hypothetical protein RIB61_13330 [Roseicyclus sp.]